MRPLWDRGEPLDQRIARFTAGRDPDLDQRLIAHDALASAAHAVMLERLGLLEPLEAAALRTELAEIAAEARAGRFSIAAEEEDAHTAIENRLTARLGDTGRRIHAGRSRNDQVIAALRLWGRETLLEQTRALIELVELLLDLAARHRETSLAGYTHGRQAMPSTVGFLFAAHAESLLDELPWLRVAFDHLNRSPLGSASGYGVALALDRALVCELLGFERVQLNALAVQNDRGKTEFLALSVASSIATDLARLAADLLWFSSDELACFRLAAELTTGSSIMPQKRNPDVLELVRAGAARLHGRQAEVSRIFAALPSGYHRDLQLTKEPFLAGMCEAVDLLAVMRPVLATLAVDQERCRALILPTTGATDALYEQIARGEPFRTAYGEVARDPEGAVSGDASEGWRRRTHAGAPGALDLAASRERCFSARLWLDDRQRAIAAAWQLLPTPA